MRPVSVVRFAMIDDNYYSKYQQFNPSFRQSSEPSCSWSVTNDYHYRRSDRWARARRRDKDQEWLPFEALWSDAHQATVRFVRQDADGLVVVANLEMGERPERVPPGRLHRPTQLPAWRPTSLEDHVGS